MSPALPPIAFIQVKASAGSGKTFALTERFLELLAVAGPGNASGACRRAADAGFGWPEILAVTFTVKAAAEMKERIVRSLKERALDLDPKGPARAMSPEQARAWVTRILRHFHQLGVRTIDSLLHLLLSLFALDLGLPPDFTPAFDLEDVFDELHDRVCAAAEAGDPTARRRLDKSLDTMLLMEDAPGFDLFPRTRERLLKLLDLRLTDHAPYAADPDRLHAALDALRRDFAHAARDMAEVLGSHGLAPSRHFQSFLDKAQAHTLAGDIPVSAYAAKPGLAECLLKASQGAVTALAEAAYSRLRQAFAAYAGNRPLLERARGLAGFLGLADALAAELPALQRRRGLLLNALWPGLAREVLEMGPPEAFCRLGARLRHLLLDEFQDTSRAQWEAILPLAEECLAKGGGVFAVGDVKQAIYGWRGGEARLFDEIADPGGLARICPVEQQALRHNWRSCRVVVEFVNRVFGPLGRPERAAQTARAMLQAAGKHADNGRAADLLARSLAAAFVGCEQEIPDKNAATRGLVRLYDVRGERKEDLLDNAKAVLRELFEDLRSRRPPGQIAVLVRSNDQAALVARWLLDWGLPVVTENSVRLAEHPAVRWLAAFLAWLDFPADDLAFWEVVSGEPFRAASGLALEELVDWLAAEAGPPLFTAFRERFPAAFAERLAPFQQEAGFMTPYDALREASRFFGLERDPADAAFVRRFLEAAHAAEEDGRQSLSAFLDWWREDGGEERAPLPASLDAVRIMTIHGAKGLEFPAVVAPFHHWRFDLASRLGSVDLDGLRLLAPLAPDMGAAYEDEAARALQEDVNLLYVAWTRAREELHALITRTPYHEARSPLLAALDQLLGPDPWRGACCGVPALERGEVPAPEPPSPAPADQPTPAAPEPDPVPDPAERPMAWLPRLKIHRHFSQDLDRAALFSRPGFDELARGTIFHEALAGLANGPGDAPAPEAAARSALALHAPLLPADLAERERLFGQVRAALDWVLAQPELAEAIRAGLPEQSILDEQGQVHRADLLARFPDRMVVLEYKTGGHAPEHREQVQRYLALLRRACPDRPARGRIAYLDLRRIEEVE